MHNLPEPIMRMVMHTASNSVRYLIAAAFFYAIYVVMGYFDYRRHRLHTTDPDRRQMVREVFTSLRSMLVFSAVVAAVLFLATLAGYTADHSGSNVSFVVLLLSFPAVVMAHDAYFYWTHRAMHHPKLFGWMHRTHHLSYKPSPWAAYAFSVPEAAVQGLFPAILIGLVPAPTATIVFWGVVQIIWNTHGHGGQEFMPRALALRGAAGLIGATHHDLHHGTVRHNFGLYTRLWDVMLGTEHPKYEQIYALVRLPANRGGAYVKVLRNHGGESDAASACGAAHPADTASTVAVV